MYESYLKAVDENREKILEISDAIYDFAETCYGEFRSSECLEDALEQEGFTVERGAGGIPTCFIATYGSGKPVIAIQAEYDALAGLSQKPCAVKPTPVKGRTNAHGCGHNLFAAGSFGAALAIKKYLEETGKGTLRLYGCPAEEGGAGKVFMVREGLYKDVDAVVSWHPTTFHMVRTRPSLANVKVEYSFKGIAAHAGGSPEKGRSALDAVELMNVGANYLREHMKTTYRLHYAMTDNGGEAPNVVQSHAAVVYLMRADTAKEAQELKRRVDLIAKGAAMMTETRMSKKVISAYSDLITVKALQTLADEAMRDTALPVPTEEDLAYAKALQKTMPGLTEEQKAKSPYATEVLIPAPPKPHGGSTDTADVSWNCPTVQMHIGNWVEGTPGHSWQAVSQGKSHFAQEATLYASKCVSGTVIRLFERPEVLAEVKREHAEKTKGGYVCPLPKNVKPALKKRPE